jgi:hypothetical protein
VRGLPTNPSLPSPREQKGRVEVGPDRTSPLNRVDTCLRQSAYPLPTRWRPDLPHPRNGPGEGIPNRPEATSTPVSGVGEGLGVR